MDKLILIHGALGNQKEFSTILPFLEKKYELHCYEIPHHGERKNSPIPFEMEAIINDFLGFLSLIGPAYVYGFSLGGYLAVAAAIKDDRNFRGIITQGTQFNWSPSIANHTLAQFKKTPKTKGEIAFQSYLNHLHGNNLDELIEQTHPFIEQLGCSPYITIEKVKHISCPVRLIRGGKDSIASATHTQEIAIAIPNGLYFEIPSLIHPIGFIPPKKTAQLLTIQLQSMHYQWANTHFGKMTYQTIGKPRSENTPIVLFLHESLGSIAQWKDFPKNLCNELQLPGMVIEFPGYGFSDAESKKRNERYLHEFAWDYLPDFLATLSIENPLFIVGHSDGGTNALLFSAKFPKKVCGIVTIAAHYLNELETIAGIQSAIEAYEKGKLKGLEWYHGNKTDRLFTAWAATWCAPEFEKWNITNDIKGIKTPTFVIQGDQDQYGTAQQAEGIIEYLTHANSGFIFDCGHQPHLEHQKTVIGGISLWRQKQNF